MADAYDEIWKPVPYKPFDEAYEVSNMGRVRPITISRYSSNRAEILKQSPSPRGYLHVGLHKNGLRKSAFVHRMVCIAFHGQPPTDKPYVCHIDDDQKNNSADNLQWGAEHDNWRDRVRNGRDLSGEKNGRAIVNDELVRAIRAEYASGAITQTQLALKYNVKQTQISRIVLRKAWASVD